MADYDWTRFCARGRRIGFDSRRQAMFARRGQPQIDFMPDFLKPVAQANLGIVGSELAGLAQKRIGLAQLALGAWPL